MKGLRRKFFNAPGAKNAKIQQSVPYVPRHHCGEEHCVHEEYCKLSILMPFNHPSSLPTFLFDLDDKAEQPTHQLPPICPDRQNLWSKAEMEIDHFKTSTFL